MKKGPSVEPELVPTLLPPTPPDLEQGDVWFYTRGREVYGPVPFQRLLVLRQTGQMSAHELIWQPHFPDWRPVSRVPGLQSGHGLLPPAPDRSIPLTAAEKFPLLILIGFTLFVVLHFALQDRRLSAQMLVGRADSAGKQVSTYEVEVCHDAKVEKAFISVSYFDAARGDWMARGWYPTTTGECQILLRGVRGPVFVFAESRDGKQTWLAASPLRKFCVHPREAFLQPQRQCDDLGDAVRWQEFMALDLPEDGGRVTWRLSEPSHE